MDGFPLKEAYARMMRTANGDRVALTPQAFYHHKAKLARGECPQEETMRAMLEKAGWSRVMDERWACVRPRRHDEKEGK